VSAAASEPGTMGCQSLRVLPRAQVCERTYGNVSVKGSKFDSASPWRVAKNNAPAHELANQAC
jgi:hypothetical protein